MTKSRIESLADHEHTLQNHSGQLWKQRSCGTEQTGVTMSRLLAAAVIIATAALVTPMYSQTASAQGPTASDKMPPEQATEENAYTIGLQAYLWGFLLHEYSRTTPRGLRSVEHSLTIFESLPN
jgi:hypothetical protein